MRVSKGCQVFLISGQVNSTDLSQAVKKPCKAPPTGLDKKLSEKG